MRVVMATMGPQNVDANGAPFGGHPDREKDWELAQQQSPTATTATPQEAPKVEAAK